MVCPSLRHTKPLESVMRAFIVLLLALALAAGVYFATQSKSVKPETDQPPALENPGGVSGPAEPKQTSANEELVDPEEDPGRTSGQGPDIAVNTTPKVTTDPNMETGTVLGRVLDSSNAPIAGASVTLTRYGSNSFFFASPGEIDRSTDLTTTTAPDGGFRFDKVPSYNMYTLVADHEMHASAEQGPLDTTSGATVELDVILGQGARMFGNIKDVQGNTVPNAVIVLAPVALGAAPGEDSPGLRETISDASGNYEFLHCPLGPHSMTVAADGYGQSTIMNINIGGEDDVERNVELDVAQLLMGRVIDENGNGMEGAKVEAFLNASRNERTQTSTMTIKDGRFEFTDVVAGSYSLRASAEGYKKAMVSRINAGEMDVEIALVPLPTISGQVLGSDGQPVASFHVNLRQGIQGSDLTMLVSNSKIKVNDAEGRYKLTPMSAGSFYVEATAGGYAPSLSEAFVVAEAQNLTGINVTLKSGGTIRGRLIGKDGSPISGAVVNTENNEWTGGGWDLSMGDAFPGNSTKKTVRTGADGEFSLTGLAPTTYLVQFKHADYAQSALRNIVVQDALQTNLKDITLERGSTISGLVRGPDGSPLSGATVRLVLESTQEFPLNFEVRTNNEGIYNLKGVRSGSYSLSAQRAASGGDNPFAGAADISKTRRSVSIGVDQAYTGEDLNITD